MLLVVVVVFLPVFTGFLELSTPVYRVSPTCYLLVSPVRRTRTQFVELKIFGIGMWQNEKFPRLFVSVSITTVFGGMSTESTRIFNRVHSLSLSLSENISSMAQGSVRGGSWKLRWNVETPIVVVLFLYLVSLLRETRHGFTSS